MTALDILDSKLNLLRPFFIEASAGCGKTFFIENAVVRLIANNEQPFNINNILVLTFTKEATRDLKARIKQALRKAITQLQSGKSDCDYLNQILQMPTEQQKQVVGKLNAAEVCFDEAQIFTIHKFCFSHLQKLLPKEQISPPLEEMEVSSVAYEQIVRDYLAFKLNEDVLSQSQFSILLSHYDYDFDKLIAMCVNQLKKEIPVKEKLNAKAFFTECQGQIQLLKQKKNFTPELIKQSYLNLAPFYKGTTNRKGVLHFSLSQSIERLANLFDDSENVSKIDLFLKDFSKFGRSFEDKQLKKNSAKEMDAKACEVHTAIEKNLFPLFAKFSQPQVILSTLIQECHSLLNVYFEKSHIMTFDGILKKLRDLVQNPKIAQEIANQYQAAIIDEFQDTDPVQWDILSKIFIDQKPSDFPFYLVGDPKQSIYGFRNADIYTYLKAASMMKVAENSTLNVNFRSQPKLIDALNTLFYNHNSQWLKLPKINKALPYQPVLSSHKIQQQLFNDSLKSLHMIIATVEEGAKALTTKKIEEDIIFPFIANEILRLHHEQHVSYDSFAILLRDRFQAARLKCFLKKYQIPFKAIRPESLQGLNIIAQFLQIFQAVLSPKNQRIIFSLKLNAILNLPLSSFEEPHLLQLFEKFMSLKKLFLEKGFLPFYTTLMEGKWLSNNSIYERILSEEDGLYLYMELEQLKELLVEQEQKGLDPHHQLVFLQKLSQNPSSLENSYPLRQNVEENAVQLLTLHMSKGLEFEIVFALGLIQEVAEKETLVVVEDNKSPFLVPSYNLSESQYQLYLEEQEAEKLRQLYVALTRAKQRVYLPCIFSGKPFSLTQSSAIESFLNQLSLNEQGLIDFISKSENISYTLCSQKIDVTDSVSVEKEELQDPSPFILNIQKKYKYSFSSLSIHSEHELKESVAPHDFQVKIKNIHNLPAGVETGILFHKILEQLFSKTRKIDLNSYLKNTPYFPWKEEIERLIEKMLDTPLLDSDSNLKLNHLQNEVYKEIEFLYPQTESFIHSEFNIQGHYLQGFIDLIFLFEGKYYLIDYKTNWLGPDEKSYLDLESAMQKNNYFLQAKIYQEAVKKFIALYDKRDFNQCFGGVFYWFIRGIDAPNKGLYYFKGASEV